MDSSAIRPPLDQLRSSVAGWTGFRRHVSGDGQGLEPQGQIPLRQVGLKPGCLATVSPWNAAGGRISVEEGSVPILTNGCHVICGSGPVVLTGCPTDRLQSSRRRTACRRGLSGSTAPGLRGEKICPAMPPPPRRFARSVTLSPPRDCLWLPGRSATGGPRPPASDHPSARAWPPGPRGPSIDLKLAHPSARAWRPVRRAGRLRIRIPPLSPRVASRPASYDRTADRSRVILAASGGRIGRSIH